MPCFILLPPIRKLGTIGQDAKLSALGILRGGREERGGYDRTGEGWERGGGLPHVRFQLRTDFPIT